MAKPCRSAGRLTVDKPRAKERAIRQTPVVHRRPRPIQCVCHGDHVAGRRSGTDVLQELPVRVVHATLPQLLVLRLHERCLGHQPVDVGLVGEVARHLDAVELDRPVPERVVVVDTIKAENVSWAVAGDVRVISERA